MLVNKIAILAPNATVSIIKNYKIEEKIKVKIPKILVGVINCSILKSSRKIL